MSTDTLEKVKKQPIVTHTTIDEINENILKIDKLAKSSKNNKFKYFLRWKQKESKLLLRELEIPRTFFTKYKRGTIIKVDFGVNLGCEFSQIHYAIVLNKKDNRKSNTINVIPLTSKDKNNTYNIGNVIFDNFITTTKKHLNEKIIPTAIEGISNVDLIKTSQTHEAIEKLTKIIDHYSKYPVSSFACFKNITTVSKTRIMKPINEYDFINITICPKNVMEVIDKKIMEHYTNIKIDE